MTEVSGIVGNTQQEAAEATVAREATKVAWQEQIFTHVVIGFVLLIISYILLTSLEWNFFWKLMTGGALIYGGGKLASVTAKLKWYWPNIIRGVGIGIILLTLLQSGFVKLIGTVINQLEEKAAGNDTPVQVVDPAEQARRVAVAKQEAEVAEAQRLAAIAAQEKARIDEQLAYDALFTPAKVGQCIRLNTDKVDCKTVEFSAYTQYDRFAPPGHCVLRTVDGLERIPLGDGSGWWRYRTTTPAVGQFFTGGPGECG